MSRGELYPWMTPAPTPSAGDFCPCGGTFQPRPHGRPGRACGGCGLIEPGVEVAIRRPDGSLAWLTLPELEELIGVAS